MGTRQQDGDTFDYVIVGAGAAGCLLAQRLAEDGRCTICLVEAGPPDRNINLHVPGGFIKAVTNPKYAWQFTTEPGAGTAGRRISIPQGRTLGGSTAINGFNYNRGQRADYDSWAQLGNRGWGYDDVLPYFRRTERRIGAHESHYRGSQGGLPVTDCDWRHPLCEAFLAAAVDAGLPRNPDYNGETQKGVGYFQRWIDKGWRVSAATAFLRPALRSGRVDLRCNAHTTAITFEGRRATGIRYRQERGGSVRVLRARREVILTCGGANSPKLLQLSGIGPAGLLADLGITPVHGLEGVGANLRDHYMIRLVARARGIETINDMARGVKLWREIAKWAIGRPSILAISPSVAYGFANARDLSLEPDIQLNFTPGSYMKSVTGVLDNFPGMTLGAYQLRPESSGYVRARSPDPFDDPVIQPNYLMHAEDQAVTVAGIRLVRRLLQSPAFTSYRDGEVSPGEDVQGDDDLLAFARENGSTAYHLIGACRMGPAHDHSAVVDDSLRVYGIDGLRVADSSIMPTMPSANTCAATYMIAEKAADLILERQAPVRAPSPPARW